MMQIILLIVISSACILGVSSPFLINKNFSDKRPFNKENNQVDFIEDEIKKYKKNRNAKT